MKIIGEAVKNLSDRFKERYEDVNWKGIAGMRNKLIHAYFGRSWRGLKLVVKWKQRHKIYIAMKLIRYMKDVTSISSIRMSRELARKVELAAKKEGISKAELVRRALEQYVSKLIDEKPKNANDILKLVEMRTGRKPKIVKVVKEIFRESYELEDL